MSWTGSFSTVIIIPSQMNTWVSDGRRQTVLFAFNYILITRGWYKLIFFLFSDGQGRLMTDSGRSEPILTVRESIQSAFRKLIGAAELLTRANRGELSSHAGRYCWSLQDKPDHFVNFIHVKYSTDIKKMMTLYGMKIKIVLTGSKSNMTAWYCRLLKHCILRGIRILVQY